MNPPNCAEPWLEVGGKRLYGDAITQYHRAHYSAGYHCSKCGAYLGSGIIDLCYYCKQSPYLEVDQKIYDDPNKPKKPREWWIVRSGPMKELEELHSSNPEREFLDQFRNMLMQKSFMFVR